MERMREDPVVAYNLCIAYLMVGDPRLPDQARSIPDPDGRLNIAGILEHYE